MRGSAFEFFEVVALGVIASPGRDHAVAAERATVACFRLQQRAATLAFVEVDAGVSPRECGETTLASYSSLLVLRIVAERQQPEIVDSLLLKVVPVVAFCHRRSSKRLLNDEFSPRKNTRQFDELANSCDRVDVYVVLLCGHGPRSRIGPRVLP